MTALVLKDLRVLRPWWWIILPGHVLFSANGILSPEMFFAMSAALAWAFTVILLIVDWSQDAPSFVASLPVSREDVVKARYAATLAATVCATALYAVYGRVLLAFATEGLRERWPGVPAWESAEGLLTFFLTVWLVSVAYLPFYFHSGLARGTGLFASSLAPLMVCGVLLMRWLSIPVSLTRPSPGRGDPAVDVVVGLVVATALGWTSLRLALRFYVRRDL